MEPTPLLERRFAQTPPVATFLKVCESLSFYFGGGPLVERVRGDLMVCSCAKQWRPAAAAVHHTTFWLKCKRREHFLRPSITPVTGACGQGGHTVRQTLKRQRHGQRDSGRRQNAAQFQAQHSRAQPEKHHHALPCAVAHPFASSDSATEEAQRGGANDGGLVCGV